VAPSFPGDFLEFVSNAAIEYRSVRGHGAGEHQHARTDCDAASVECAADSANVYASLKWRKSSENGLKSQCMLPPDLILHGGKIITLDGSSRLAQAISVRAGHVAAVGDDAALLKEAAPTTRLIDLKGRSVLPGFFDAHPHADREGLKARGGIPIAGLHSVADIVDVVKRAAQTTPAGEWIVLMPMGEPPHEYISRPEQ